MANDAIPILPCFLGEQRVFRMHPCGWSASAIARCATKSRYAGAKPTHADIPPAKDLLAGNAVTLFIT